MSKLSVAEQAAVASLKADYDKLSTEAKAEAAKVVSWAEKHFWPWTVAVAVLAAAIGHFA